MIEAKLISALMQMNNLMKVLGYSKSADKAVETLERWGWVCRVSKKPKNGDYSAPPRFYRAIAITAEGRAEVARLRRNRSL